MPTTITRSTRCSDSPLSREGAFFANNLVFAVFAFVVLLGTVFPLIVEAINGDRISVGALTKDVKALDLSMRFVG